MANKKDNDNVSKIRIETNSRIRMHKGYVSLVYSTHRESVSKWEENEIYKQGDIIWIDITKPDPKKSDFWNRCFKRLGLWSMCMEHHMSDHSNKPHDGEIFNDLLIDITPYIEAALITHVKGFNKYLSNIIMEYTYKTNKYWWNGCSKKLPQKSTVYFETCGNLMYGLNAKYCKKCAQSIETNNDIQTTLNNPISGSVINLNKTTGEAIRVIVNENKSNNDKCDMNKSLIFNSKIECKLKKQKIYSLLKRNFNDSMDDLINCCIKNEKVFRYNNKQINLGNVNIWALYGNYEETELLCGLLWRSVERIIHVESKYFRKILMFEILFLSTSEHIRYQHYGKEMVKRINSFAISNCYDIISVAAVPRHGVSFWSNNGFKMKYDTGNKKGGGNKTKEQELYDFYSNKKNQNEWIKFMKNNMLVFDDTPLFAKFLT